MLDTLTDQGAQPGTVASKAPVILDSISGSWTADFSHVDGSKFSRSFKTLHQFGRGTDPQLASFAGTVEYKTDFISNGVPGWIQLGPLNRGIAEVTLNGKNLGTCWYGLPLFDCGGALISGNNTLTIRYTTVLSNYVTGLKDNATAQRWAKNHDPIKIGLDGAVKLLSSIPQNKNDK